MSSDALRELQKTARQINNLTPDDIGVNSIPPRTCFIVASPRTLLDTSSYFDALKASRIFIRADFKVFFLISPEYCDFHLWYTFFLKNVYEYLALVFTGFPMVSPDGGPETGIPFRIKDQEVTPTKIFKELKKYKHPASRVTYLINGCPAAETWSNGGENVEKMAFSKTSLTFKQPTIQQFANELPEKVVLMTSALRLDTSVTDRAKSGFSHFISDLSTIVKNDPVLNAAEVVEKLGPLLRPHGEELIVYASSYDVESETPLLL